MKTRTIILFCFLLFGISNVSLSQDGPIIGPSPKDLQYSNLQVHGEIQKTLDIVLPGVIIRYKYDMTQTEEGKGFLEALFNNKTYSLPQELNQLLFDLDLKREHEIEISDENLAKAYVYLSLLQGPEPIINNNVDKVIVKKENSSYPKPENTRLSDDLLKFNYHISVIYSESD